MSRNLFQFPSRFVRSSSEYFLTFFSSDFLYIFFKFLPNISQIHLELPLRISFKFTENCISVLLNFFQTSVEFKIFSPKFPCIRFKFPVSLVIFPCDFLSVFFEVLFNFSYFFLNHSWNLSHVCLEHPSNFCNILLNLLTNIIHMSVRYV